MKARFDPTIDTCRICCETKPVGDFYPCPERGTGYMSACKSCHRAHVRRNYQERKALGGVKRPRGRPRKHDDSQRPSA